MKAKLTGLIFPLLLVSAGFILAGANYTQGTFLSGWDTLHPEFNLLLYLQRIFWGVWQQHQGLGAVAVQAQASELGRLWYLIPGSILPENLFRYGYFWIALITGPLGICFLLMKFQRRETAFLGGLFYLLNLGTMQHFYLPLEMFATAYAFLPWLFWAVVSKKIRLLILFFILSAPMAHTPTLWLVNFLALVIFALIYDRRWGIKVVIIGVIANSFWLLPVVYYLLTHGEAVAGSHISQQFSARAILTSKEFGNLFDIALIRGYLFDWGHFDFVSRQFADLFPVWKNYLANRAVMIVGYGSFILAIGGILSALKNRLRLGVAMIPVLLISILGLIAFADTETLRFPFTKFSFLLILSLSVYFGIAVSHIKKLWVVVALALVFYMYPAFTGNLICDCEKVVFPVEYQQTFNWFAEQNPDARIAPFPIDSFYGWGYYAWGYEGAGFRWFGLPQPILDREFDRWMPQNENYYWEISRAVYSKNLPLFESVLNKYRINWLLVDENIINPSSPKALYTQELEDLAGQSKVISLSKQFGRIKIYSVTLQVPTTGFISIVQNLPKVGPSYKWGDLDQAYFDLGDYKVGSDVIYPYRSLFTGRTQGDLEFDPVKLPAITTRPSIKIGPENDKSQWRYPDLSHRDGYLITVKARNISGQPFLFWIEDLNSRRSVMETYLPGVRSPVTDNFVLPPMEPDGLGYSFHLDSNTFGKEISRNELESIEIRPIDYWGMVTANKQRLRSSATVVGLDQFIVEHPNPALYRIDLGVNKPSTLILSQSFDAGWIAISADGNQNVSSIDRHIPVNNWANGWELTGSERVVYLFYWPQLLEFAGLGLFGLLTIAVFGRIMSSRLTS